MPSRNELLHRLLFVNTGLNGFTHPLNPVVSNALLECGQFSDRFKSKTFQGKCLEIPGYLRSYIRAASNAEYNLFVNFIEGYNTALTERKLYALAIPEANTLTIMVFKEDPSPYILEWISSVV